MLQQACPRRWQTGQMAISTGVVRLVDGRWSQFAEFGAPRDAPAVLYCHGWPGSRWEIGWGQQVLAERRHPVRVIAANRPGYGRSSWVPLAGFRSWVADAATVLDRLGVASCAVLGASGGAPFALACAAELGERVSRVAIVAGVGPMDTPGMSRSAVAGTTVFGMGSRWPLLAAVRGMGLDRWQEERMLAALPDPDRRALRAESARATLHRVAAEGFAQVGRAAAHEERLYRRPWDLALDAVHQPVKVWHGGADTRVPAEVGNDLAQRVRDGSFHCWPQHGHFSWATSPELHEVIGFLTADSSGQIDS
jgi:pimeloyl-ACP methyl ester carboxylesterase